MGVAVACAGTGVLAQSLALRELDRAEVRARATEGRAMALPRILDRVAEAVTGEAIDVRAFDAGGVLVYRVLVLRPDGQVVSVVVDAGAGRILPNTSAVATGVREAARAQGAASAGQGGPAWSADAGPVRGGGRGPEGSGPPGQSGDGPGNAGGNGGGSGNGGGNGNGNGDGNGNGGGNGNGNGGGNGGGNGNGNGNGGGNGG